jgi:CRISPR/Cas system-associated protein Csm6
MYSILMKLVLLGAPLNCAEANELLSLVKPFDPNRLEMTKVIIAHTDPVCFEDANAD